MNERVPLTFRETVTRVRAPTERTRKDDHFYASEEEGYCPFCL